MTKSNEIADAFDKFAERISDVTVGYANRHENYERAEIIQDVLNIVSDMASQVADNLRKAGQ